MGMGNRELKRRARRGSGGKDKRVIGQRSSRSTNMVVRGWFGDSRGRAGMGGIYGRAVGRDSIRERRESSGAENRKRGIMVMSRLGLQSLRRQGRKVGRRTRRRKNRRRRKRLRSR